MTAELFDLAAKGALGDRRSLARLLSIVERGGPGAREVSRLAYGAAGGGYSVGVTGAPGSGKSTLVARLVGEALSGDLGPVAVLAVDPSSPLTGGAILGDRVRMQDHALDRNVYIRSMATRGHLGGLAAAVPDAVRLLDACGWPLVIVETVGVGQVEVDVAGTCDTVVLVLNPRWGDAVQANKAGLLELADVLVVNKADLPGVRETKRDLVHMLQMGGERDWVPPIVETVAESGEGVDGLLGAISSHRSHLEASGQLARRRAARALGEAERLARSALEERVSAALAGEGGLAGEAAALRGRLASGEIDPAEAADELVRLVGGAVSQSGPG